MFDPARGKTGRYTKFRFMPRDLATILRMKAARSHRGADHVCSGCHRVPLAGELLHELSSHRRVCQLCLARLPESKRETIASERIHVSDRPLAVAPRAA
jgi:hypothetical protein